jgi:hypothetical protein
MNSLLRRCALALCLLPWGALSAGCAHGGDPAPIANALIGTAIGVGASAYSRSQGGCYASCPTGTRCNPATGFCDAIPCRGECGPNEECVELGLRSRCIVLTPVGGDVHVDPPAKASEPTSSEPTSSEPKP